MVFGGAVVGGELRMCVARASMRLECIGGMHVH